MKRMIKKLPLAVATNRKLQQWRAAKAAKAKQGQYKLMVDRVISFCGGVEGKRILEVGCSSDGDFVGDLVRGQAVDEAIGINLGFPEPKILSSSLRLQYGDIRKTDFKDDYFDVIISSSVFEHIHDLSKAMDEMNRILKPGGFVFSHFGPIWSGAYGHHLWIYKDSKCINYHNLVLPPYCHLLMTETGLLHWLEERRFPHAESIVDSVFNSKDQNQLMFSDYEKIFKTPQWNMIFLKGYNDGGLHQSYAVQISAETLDQLNSRYPKERDRFLYDGITVLLQKSGVSKS